MKSLLVPGPAPHAAQTPGAQGWHLLSIPGRPPPPYTSTEPPSSRKHCIQEGRAGEPELHVERWPGTTGGRETSGKGLPGEWVPPHPAGTSAAPVLPSWTAGSECVLSTYCVPGSLEDPSPGALPSRIHAHPAKFTPWPRAPQTPTTCRPPAPHAGPSFQPVLACAQEQVVIRNVSRVKSCITIVSLFV